MKSFSKDQTFLHYETEHSYWHQTVFWELRSLKFEHTFLYSDGLRETDVIRT